MDAGAEEPDDVVLDDDGIPDDLLEPEGFDDGAGEQLGPDDDEWNTNPLAVVEQQGHDVQAEQ
jgi:hypothetical protein